MIVFGTKISSDQLPSFLRIRVRVELVARFARKHFL